MKIITLLSLALLLSVSTIAKPTGKISLKIIDKQQNSSAGAFVELLNAKDSSLARFASTGKDGTIDFSNLAQGSYVVFIPQIGGKNYLSFTLKISRPEEMYEMTLTCPASNEITVVAGRSIFTKKITKLS
ncbi:MAG TPA: hypothetical protein VK783_05330 [Bacteroidia bacterium]|nr:hypothetical protein [Bacteroidia bacterium]